MPDTNLKSSLAQLREEIKQLGEEHLAARERIDRLLEKIEESLASSSGSRERHALIDELRDTVKSFEIQHPRASSLVQEWIKALVNIGV